MKLNNQLEDHLVEQATKRLSNELFYMLLKHPSEDRVFSAVLGKLGQWNVEKLTVKLINKYAYSHIKDKLILALNTSCYSMLSDMFRPFILEVSSYFDNVPQFECEQTDVFVEPTWFYSKHEFIRFANAFIAIAKYDSNLNKILQKYNKHVNEVYYRLKEVVERDNNVSE